MTRFGIELKDNVFEIIESISEEILISDGKGVVLWVNSGFEKSYGVKESDAIGATVYEMEQKGYFKPSVIAKVLRENEKVTMLQKSNRGKDILVTATPIYDDHGGIKLVVSYSRDVTEMTQLQASYSRMKKQMAQYTAELNALRKEAESDNVVVGKSRQMETIINTIDHIADFDTNVLILGESGVGKSMFAEIIHKKSHRHEGPFIDINCAAMPYNLLDSELFGYEGGSFTGANAKGKKGLMELADKGTLMLDEISEIPLSLQAKILKAIQEKRIRRVGGTQSIDVDFRLIAASNRDLEKDAAEGKFRSDLYYRLNVINIKIPPLRERIDDIIPLIEYYMSKFNAVYKLGKSLTPQAIDRLTSYQWPGNIRELANVMERIIVTSDGDTIDTDSLPEEIMEAESGRNRYAREKTESLGEALESLERDLITEAYDRYHTTTGVAKALKISQPTAFRKVSKYVKAAEEHD